MTEIPSLSGAELLYVEGQPFVEQCSLPKVELKSSLFQQLDIFGTHFPLLVADTPAIDACKLSDAPMGLEILCGLSDPSNLGALLRSAEAFGASQVILLKEAAHPFHPKAVRASSGSCLRVPLTAGPSIKEIHGAGPILALDKTGESIAEFNWPKDCRLLIGEEGLGIPDDLISVQRISIPMQGQVESLNAVAATSVALAMARWR